MEISRTRINPLRMGIIVLTLATALIHLFLGINANDSMVLVTFGMNFLAYVVLLAAYFLPVPFFQRNHRLVRFALLGLTLVTILLWVVMGERTTIGFVDKAVEVMLVVFLLLDR